MSVQYKCERCNAVTPVKYENGHQVMPDEWMRLAFLQRNKRHLDFCPKCLGDLMKFVGVGAIGAVMSSTDIDIEEILSSGFQHGFSVAFNHERKPKEFFATYAWLDEIDSNADHYKYMFCDDYVTYWTFARLLYEIAADCAARWVYAKRNGLSWVFWDSDYYEGDKEKEDETEPEAKAEPEAESEPEADPIVEKEHRGSCPTYWEGKPCILENGHEGKHVYASSGDEQSDTLDAKRFECPNEIDGRRCIKDKGHAGDCSFLCDDPNCPGYSWPASEKQPHPMSTCKP